MKRLLGSFGLALVLFGATSSASGQLISFGNPKQAAPLGSRTNPLAVGPWYAYWPLESHFQVPGAPGFPNYGSPLTLPVGPTGMGGNYPPMPGGNMPGFPPQMPYAAGYPGANAFAAGQPGAMPYGSPYGGYGQQAVNPYAGFPYGMPGAGHPALAYPQTYPTGYPMSPYFGQQPAPQANPAVPAQPTAR